jgi:hypothetical protein
MHANGFYFGVVALAAIHARRRRVAVPHVANGFRPRGHRVPRGHAARKPVVKHSRPHQPVIADQMRAAGFGKARVATATSARTAIVYAMPADCSLRAPAASGCAKAEAASVTSRNSAGTM